MKRSFVLAVAVYILALCTAWIVLRDLRRPSFLGDGVGYYAPLASLLVDGDLDLHNELAHLNPRYLRAAFMTPEGKLGNPFPIGPAVLWFPGLWVFKHLPPSPFLDAPLPVPSRTPHPGFSARFARAVQWTDLWMIILAGSLWVLLLTPLAGGLAAAGVMLSIVFATPLFYYVLVDPAYGHASSFFAIALLSAAAWHDRRRRLPLELLGFLWGFAALVRSQDAVFGILLAPRLLDEWGAGAGSIRRRLLLLARFLVPAIVAFSPQMLFWQRIYGRPLLIPPGPDLLPFWKPQLVHLLFSTWNGAFIWSPLLLLGFAGLALVPDRRLRWAMGVAILLELYSSATLLDWWGGNAFGPRRLVSVLPLAAVGVALLLQRMRSSRVQTTLLLAALALLCVTSVRAGQYKAKGLLPQNPGNAADYVRHHPIGSPQAHTYGHWDYPRLIREAFEAERLLRAENRRD